MREPNWAILLALALALVVCCGCAGARRQEAHGGPFWGFALHGHPVTERQLAGVENSTGVRPRIVVFYLQWPRPGGEGHFPVESLRAIWRAGALPVLTWEPASFENGNLSAVPHGLILDGTYDEYITRFARQAKKWERPFVIRFAHEMNTKKYHWGTSEKDFGPESTAIYQKIFRHVVDIFRKEGALNALWAFCPNAESVPAPAYEPGSALHPAWNRAENYYPGDGYVEILGMDGYNWGFTRKKKRDGWESRWKSFREIFGPLYEDLKRLSPEKPVVVFETASVAEGGDKPAWIREAVSAAREWGISGIAWFEAVAEEDWRLESGMAGQYRELIEGRRDAREWARRILHQKLKRLRAP